MWSSSHAIRVLSHVVRARTSPSRCLTMTHPWPASLWTRRSSSHTCCGRWSASPGAPTEAESTPTTEPPTPEWAGWAVRFSLRRPRHGKRTGAVSRITPCRDPGLRLGNENARCGLAPAMWAFVVRPDSCHLTNGGTTASLHTVSRLTPTTGALEPVTPWQPLPRGHRNPPSGASGAPADPPDGPRRRSSMRVIARRGYPARRQGNWRATVSRPGPAGPRNGWRDRYARVICHSRAPTHRLL